MRAKCRRSMDVTIPPSGQRVNELRVLLGAGGGGAARREKAENNRHQEEAGNITDQVAPSAVSTMAWTVMMPA